MLTCDNFQDPRRISANLLTFDRFTKRAGSRAGHINPVAARTGMLLAGVDPRRGGLISMHVVTGVRAQSLEHHTPRLNLSNHPL